MESLLSPYISGLVAGLGSRQTCPGIYSPVVFLPSADRVYPLISTYSVWTLLPTCSGFLGTDTQMIHWNSALCPSTPPARSFTPESALSSFLCTHIHWFVLWTLRLPVPCHKSGHPSRCLPLLICSVLLPLTTHRGQQDPKRVDTHWSVWIDGKDQRALLGKQDRCVWESRGGVPLSVCLPVFLVGPKM